MHGNRKLNIFVSIKMYMLFTSTGSTLNQLAPYLGYIYIEDHVLVYINSGF